MYGTSQRYNGLKDDKSKKIKLPKHFREKGRKRKKEKEERKRKKREEKKEKKKTTTYHM